MPGTTTKQGLESRGRPRERERRAPGVMKERSRERARTKNRTGAAVTGASSRAHQQDVPERRGGDGHGQRLERESNSNSIRRSNNINNNNDRSRERNQMQQQQQQSASTKLRMDRGRDKELLKSAGGGGGGDNDGQVTRKRQGELDRVVKRAREERSSYWNKRVLEAEEKDPNRWGHSGFKELYKRDMKISGGAKSGSPSAAPPRVTRRSPQRGRQPQRRAPNQEHSRDGGGGGGLGGRARSRSKSPRHELKSRSNRQGGSSYNSQRSPPRPLMETLRRTPPPIKDSNRNPRDKRRNNDKASSSGGINERRPFSDRTSGSKSGSRHAEEKNSGTDSYRGWSDKRDSNLRGHARKSPADSLPRSRTRSSLSPPAKLKRSSNLGSKVENKGNDSWNRSSNAMDTSSPRRSRSRSRSTSSSSSEDGDVLEIHAKSRRKGSSISSHSSTSSSDDDSKSNSSSTSAASSSKRKKASGSSSSSSSSDSDSDDSDVSGKIDARRKPGSSSTYNKDADKTSGSAGKGKPGESSSSRTAPKRPSAAASSSAAAARSKVPRKSARDSKFGGDSDSDSGSSSDSDSEPRMTLSERFAKLTQMSTDKREFAKPVIAMNEIDTKLKVVKDLRNADVKIYMDGLQQRMEPASSAKTRPKSPDYNYADGEKRFSSDERHRHFERMAKDEPRDRPPEWSDSRVRFEYYRDRGYFNDRPISFDEYAKWEQWWYEYRDWLETEGYYSRMDPNNAPLRGNHHGQYLGPPDGGGRPPPGRGGPPGVEWGQPPAGLPPRMRPVPAPARNPPPNRRVEQVPVRMIPLSSRAHFMGRSDGGPGVVVRGRGGHHPGGAILRRSIDRTPGGSLVVNIRQGASFGPRGRHVGLIHRGGRPR